MIKENYNLKSLNTFKIDVIAKYFIEISSVADLLVLLKTDIYKQNKSLILGGGSNILFTQNYDGLIILINIKGIEKQKEDDNYVQLKVNSGENWHQFIEFTVNNNFYGLENLALIPGKVGSAPVQNIGAYGIEQVDAFYALEGINLETNEITTLSKVECKFDYRNSIFKNELKEKFIITSVNYKLSKSPNFKLDYGEINDELKSNNLEINQLNIFNSIVKIRSRKLPNPELIGNCGSFFKNPIVDEQDKARLTSEFPNCKSFKTDIDYQYKLSAAWLIENVGWKGKSYLETDAAVSENHSLVLINKGNAKGEEILDLSKQIISDVFNKFGVTLEREVNII